jgi:hypothetical protein
MINFLFIIALAIIFAIPLLSIFDLIKFTFTGKTPKKNLFRKITNIIIIIVIPLLYLYFIDINENYCCSESATFSPNHKYTIYFYISICVINYFYSYYRLKIASPVIEVIVNIISLFGFIFNIITAIQAGSIFILGNISIGVAFLFQIIENHKLFINSNQCLTINKSRSIRNIAINLLNLNILIKIPALLILFFPIIILSTTILLLFGQKPDSIVKAFTETYKHGFSELDYLCENVQCGEHFLCSVAANGHKKIVNPIRYGLRGGGVIICNRQLLIANAFEEIIEEKFPQIHNVIRRNYNKVGNLIHRHYHIFNNKIVSDIVYFLMKPLEYFFLIFIYTFDRNPENRIALQYLKNE